MGGKILKLRSEILREEGWESGRKSGREEGREESLRIFIEDKIEDGCSEDTIISKLVRHYHFSPEEAKARYRSCSLQSV